MVNIHNSTIRGKTQLNKKSTNIKNLRIKFYKLMGQRLNFLEDIGPVTSGTEPTLHFTKGWSCQQSNMVLVVWWSGADFLVQDLNNLSLLMEPWLLLSIRKSWRRMSARQFVIESSSAVGLCRTQASPPLNGGFLSIDCFPQQLNRIKDRTLAQKKQNESFGGAKSMYPN